MPALLLLSFWPGKIQMEHNYAERGWSQPGIFAIFPGSGSLSGRIKLCLLQFPRKKGPVCQRGYFPPIPHARNVQFAIAAPDAPTSPTRNWGGTADAGEAKLNTAPPVKRCCTDALRPPLGLRSREFPYFWSILCKGHPGSEERWQRG